MSDNESCFVCCLLSSPESVLAINVKVKKKNIARKCEWKKSFVLLFSFRSDLAKKKKKVVERKSESAKKKFLPLCSSSARWRHLNILRKKGGEKKSSSLVATSFLPSFCYQRNPLNSIPFFSSRITEGKP